MPQFQCITCRWPRWVNSQEKLPYSWRPTYDWKSRLYAFPDCELCVQTGEKMLGHPLWAGPKGSEKIVWGANDYTELDFAGKRYKIFRPVGHDDSELWNYPCKISHLT
jgi:hypothetical protein